MEELCRALSCLLALAHHDTHGWAFSEQETVLADENRPKSIHWFKSDRLSMLHALHNQIVLGRDQHAVRPLSNKHIVI